MTQIKIANSGPFALTCLECDLHQKLLITSRVVRKECLLQVLQKSIDLFRRYIPYNNILCCGYM